MSDIKPQVGPIPDAVQLPPVSLGKNFFKVELVVGEDNGPGATRSSSRYELMKPFHQKTIDGDLLSIDYYVATPGLSFAIRCKLSRPVTDDSLLYGARVYIDSGDFRDTEKAFKKWGDPSDSSSKSDNTDTDTDTNEDIDFSQADHYFWLSPGQQEHTIHGFYRSEGESERFVFAEPPPRKRSVDGDSVVNFVHELNKIGTIRVMFCCVDSKASKTIRNKNNGVVKPQQATIDDRCDEKIKMSAKPGSVVKDGCSPSKFVEILEKDILYERRLIYNTYEGFTARRVTTMYSNRVEFYKGMPLQCLFDKKVRFQGIMVFFRKVAELRTDQATALRIDLTTEQRTIDTEASMAAAPQVMTNDWVCVEDLVRYVSKSLSPAGSYLVCTGKHYRASNNIRDYGEKYVQKQGTSQENKLRNFSEKEDGLVDFFKKNPGVYDLEPFRINQRIYTNENSYKVKLSVVEILNSSDEE